MTEIEHSGVKGMKWGVHKAVSGSGYQRSGIVRVHDSAGLPERRKRELANLVATSHLATAKKAVVLRAQLSEVNSRYDAKKFKDDPKYFEKYRREVKTIHEDHTNSFLPSGLSAKVFLPPDPSWPFYVVIGNKAGVSQESKLLAKEGFKHADALAIVYQLDEKIDSEGYVIDMTLGGEVSEDDLAHSGVKGMHWGIRRPRGANGLVVKTSSSHVSLKELHAKRSEKAAKATGKTAPSAKHLTDDQLRAVIARHDLEKKYSKMVAEQRKKNPAQKVAGKIIGKAADTIVNEIGTAIGKKGAEKVLANPRIAAKLALKAVKP